MSRTILVVLSLASLGMQEPHRHKWKYTTTSTKSCSGGFRCAAACVTKDCNCGESEDKGCSSSCQAEDDCK
jgi:hypothetical protein